MTLRGTPFLLVPLLAYSGERRKVGAVMIVVGNIEGVTRVRSDHRAWKR